MRKLLEHGADATVTDTRGKTPLACALSFSLCSQEESPFSIIYQRAKKFRIIDGILEVSEWRNSADKLLDLLGLDKEMAVDEHVICGLLGQSLTDSEILDPLMHRTAGIGVTENMLEATKNASVMRVLLRYHPVCKVNLKVLRALKDLESIKMLLDFDHDVEVTESLVIHVLELNYLHRQRDLTSELGDVGKEVIGMLWGRNPHLVVTEDMVRASQSATNLKYLLERLQADSRTISEDVVEAVSKIFEEAYKMMRVLLPHDPNIQLTSQILCNTILHAHRQRLYCLETFLEINPDILVTVDILILFFWGSHAQPKQERDNLADIFYRHGKKLIFTKEMRDEIDTVFSIDSSKVQRELMYSLGEKDADSDADGSQR